MTELAYPSGLPHWSSRMRLLDLRDELRPRRVLGFRNVGVGGVAFHSAEVRRGNVFFAVRGTHRDGGRFAAQALSRGAVAVVAEEPLPLSCPVLVVDDCRRALADAAAFYYGHPSRSLQVVGVTGTNGKSTIVRLLRACLEADRRSVGLIGTIGFEYGGRRVPSNNTTPDPVRLQGWLRDLVDQGAHACAVEVTSHGLVQERVRGVAFDLAVFSNLTQDHLDYHGDMRAYADAKARLFESLDPGAQACVCIDSPGAGRMIEAVAPGVELHTFGERDGADLRAENVRCSLDGTEFDLVTAHGRVELKLPLVGRHNVQNALAAASAALALGVSELTVAAALENVEPVPGRLDMVGRSHGVRVFVDYAHTPDALLKVCSCLAELTEGRLLVVFGCGGDRDRSKRAPMGRVATRLADAVYLTSDNPRSEDPERILDDIMAGCAEFAGELHRIADRRAAIHAAVHDARPGDTVLIAGKGHETCQILHDSVVPFDDSRVARQALAEREAVV